MRVINIDELEWFQVKFQGQDEYWILIRKPHINDLDWFEIEPVQHGYWIPTRPYLGSTKCSICGKVWGAESPHCPSCGAKMDLERPIDE